MSSRPSLSRSVPASRRPAGPARGGLTTRSAVLALVVCALVVSAAVPLREYLSQRTGIARVQAAQRQQQARVDGLEHKAARLEDPAYVRSQATLRLHYVLPGQTAYVVLAPGQPATVPGPLAVGRATATGPQAPWYSQVWGTVRAADAPARLSR